MIHKTKAREGFIKSSRQASSSAPQVPSFAFGERGLIQSPDRVSQLGVEMVGRGQFLLPRPAVRGRWRVETLLSCSS